MTAGLLEGRPGKCEGELEMRHGRLVPYMERDWEQSRNLGCFLVSKEQFAI